MPPIDPRLVKAKRYPVHAAVILCNEHEVRRLVDPDAAFHLARKMPDTEVSALHVACYSRPGPKDVIVRMVEYLIKMCVPLHDVDAAGQTALHYAVCNMDHAEDLTALLMAAGCDVNAKRKIDGWTPIHLATMFGKVAVVKELLRAGADPILRAELRDLDTVNAEQLARKFGSYQLSDIISSPMKLHRPDPVRLPDDVFGDLVTKVHSEWDPSKPLPTPAKFKEQHLNWRDTKGNAMLHVVAWNGDIKLARAIFDNIKARKQTNLANTLGATPLAMAVIASRDTMIEEFFQNKHSKKLIEFGVRLEDTEQNMLHLLLQYAPTVPPKFMLKRKDLSRETLNAQDGTGDSPLLKCARRNSRQSIYRMFVSKNVKDHKMLDLSLRNKEGNDILYYLIRHNDISNFRQYVDRDELTEELARRHVTDGETPLAMCLRLGRMEFVRAVMLHPTAKDKFAFPRGNGKPGLLHLLAERKNVDDLWDLALARNDCCINDVDENGNTPLMKAVTDGRHRLVERCLDSPSLIKEVDSNMKNNSGNTLLHLAVTEDEVALSPYNEIFFKTLLKRLDFKESVNAVNTDGETVLLKAARLERWDIVRLLIDSDKVGEEVDVHIANAAGNTCLVIILLARIKLARQEQTHNMKKERTQAVKARLEYETLWEVVCLVLAREKEMHGPSMVQGRDGGSDCVKKQMEKNKLIRTPTPGEVVTEFARQYNTMLKGKKKPLSRQTSTESQGTKTGDSINNLIEKATAKLTEEKQRRTSIDGDGAGGLLEELLVKANKKTIEDKKAAEEAVNKKVEGLKAKSNKEQGANVDNTETKKKKKKVVKSTAPKKATSNELPPEAAVPILNGHSEEGEAKLEKAAAIPTTPHIEVKKAPPIPQELRKASPTNLTVEPDTDDSKREWSPTPAPRTRRQRSPLQLQKACANGKPPIPDGPSPPPPDDQEYNGTPNGCLSYPSASVGFSWTDISATRKVAVEGTDKLEAGVGPGKADAWTQTDFAVWSLNNGKETQTMKRCCCTCGQPVPTRMQ